MKHTEQDQPIHVNADRDYDVLSNYDAAFPYDAYEAIEEDVPEWNDDQVFVEWYLDLVECCGQSIASARNHIDRKYREYREYLNIIMTDGKEEA